MLFDEIKEKIFQDNVKISYLSLFCLPPTPLLLPSFLNIEFPVLALTGLHGNLTFFNGFADCLIIVMISINCNNGIIIIIIRVLSGLLMIIIE